MTSTTLEPVLVSELPPAPHLPTLGQRVRKAVRERVWEQRFERALRQASHNEASDLLAAARRD
jgi:hypothetical protein